MPLLPAIALPPLPLEYDHLLAATVGYDLGLHGGALYGWVTHYFIEAGPSVSYPCSRGVMFFVCDRLSLG